MHSRFPRQASSLEEVLLDDPMWYEELYARFLKKTSLAAFPYI